MSDPQRFAGRVAIVTGAVGGIGFATAKRLAFEGASVVVADLDPVRIDTAVQELQKTDFPQHWGTVCNVAQESQVTATVAGTMERFGRLDIIVNNAGTMIFKPLEEHTEADWQKILQVNLMGAFFFIKQAFLHMKPGSAIVNVASIHAEVTSPLVCSYAASKAALVSLTRSASIEGKAKGIRINAVLPGAVDTPMLWDNPNVKSGAEKFERDDIGTPDEIAAAICFLASNDASFVQGVGMRVEGGRLVRV